MVTDQPTIPDAAVEAAARAMAEDHGEDWDHPSVAIYGPGTGDAFLNDYRRTARLALAAAYPLLAAQALRDAAPDMNCVHDHDLLNARADELESTP